MRYGYASLNLTLSAEKIRVNRSMIRRVFLEKGLVYASQLALANITDLEKVIEWNIQHGLFFHRMSSDMIPWMSEYELPDLPDYAQIRDILARCGQKAAAHSFRLTFHPGPFNVLASNSALVITKTTKELRQHAEIMDLIGLPPTPFAKINIHVGGAFGDKPAALARFAENYLRLPDTTRQRLTVENDDKGNMFSVQDLLWLYQEVGIPVAFDYFHHEFCTGGLSEREAFLAAVDTWPTGITPVVHFSSSKKKWEDPSALPTAHADYIYSEVNTYNKEVDIMFEAKAKETAVLKYLNDYKIKSV
ncbi:MAG: UV DNA damage repair endonuclease UvsE [Williamsia sp.]|nr:UV DNA damage repair endonuclease UvsE [Williamsia sp.]